MKLRKQLFTAFLMVAFLPLAVVGIYIFVTNIMLAFDLHDQNLQDSTQIQAEMVEDNINRLMVRARRFASSGDVRLACREGISQETDTTAEISKDILNFADETLDNVAIFALLDGNGEFLYSSGSNSDSLNLKENLPQPLFVEEQYIDEILFNGQDRSLIIYTPVQENDTIVGTFLIVCRTDYLLKLISSHRQLESTNALIYCMDHQKVVTSKQPVAGKLCGIDEQLANMNDGSLICRIDGKLTLSYYKKLSRMPWVLVGTISVGQILSKVWSYGLINIIALLLVLLIIVFMSHKQSRRILYPMDQLLEAVEKFFIGGESNFPKTDIEPKSEIGFLAEKFTNLSDEITVAQGKLRESNYLYAALLKATFEFRIVIDLKSGKVECSSGSLWERLNQLPGENASERIWAFLAPKDDDSEPENDLHRIVYGGLNEPMEAEVYCSKEEGKEKSWYRVVAVPVIQGGSVWRVVLHFEDITEQKREEQRLIQSSQTDLLCGVYNKTAFPLHCKLSEDGSTDAMFFIDLDKFKQVNDTLGHAAGDNVLVSTAHGIRAQFRGSDVVGRFGGDEFVVFAPGISKEMALQKARRLLDTISFYLDTPKNTEIHVTASVGICMVTPPVTVEQAIQLADEAMYHAKENGRAQYYLYQAKDEK